MTLTTLQLERSGPVARLRLNRPGKRNAQTVEMWRELGDVGAKLTTDATVRALVLSGNGPAFSAGIDLEILLGQAAGKSELPVDVEQVQRAFSWLREAPFPTIAAVQGHALGAGMQLALACDLRILAEDAVLGLPEIDFGIFPDLGGCAWLPDLVGSAKAKELVFTGDRLTAVDGLRLGLANQVVPVGELERAATALAERLAAKAPLGIRMAKRAIDAAQESFDAALRASAAGVKRCLASDDFREAGLAAIEKRAPRYRGR
jgi:enoyl-CoA hydratase/carnithine racemase